MQYLFLRSQLKTLMLTKNSPLRFKKKLKRKRLWQGQSSLNCRVNGQNGVALLKLDLCRKSVLQGLISVFQSFLSSYTVSNTNCNTSIKFVKAGLKPKKSIKKKVGLLHFAPGWKLQFNLNNKLVIPLFVTVSQLRQDVVVYSLSTKTVTMSFVLGNGFHSLVSASFS